MIESIDTLLSGGVICALIVLARAAWQAPELKGVAARRFGSAFCVCFAIYIFATSSAFKGNTSAFWLVLRIIEAPNLVFLWLFLLAIFQDEFQLGLLHLTLGGGYVVLMIIERLGEADLLLLPNAMQLLFLAGSIVLITHATWVLVREWGGDLVTARRRSRAAVIVLILAAALFSVVTNNAAQLFDDAIPGLVGISAVFLVLLVVCNRWLRFAPGELFLPSKETHPAASAVITHKQSAHLSRLSQAMEDEELFRDPTLKIGRLAKHLGLSEHALRDLINQKMGYRNFSAFLNHYRVEHAKGLLSDPLRADERVLSIAMESGFNSLSVFNKAFREETDLTPKEYRQKSRS